MTANVEYMNANFVFNAIGDLKKKKKKKKENKRKRKKKQDEVIYICTNIVRNHTHCSINMIRNNCSTL